ncbi:MAG: MFS transporter [Rhodospirillales bacterium]|nr:MFS transporter [Rhodospirillales bacterium]
MPIWVRLAVYFGGFARALSSRNYRIYWSGQIAYVQGLWIYRVAAGWMMFDLTASPAWLGAMGFAFAAPFLILSPIAGAICDRLGYRRTAMIALSGATLVMLVTAILSWAGAITPPVLFILMGAISIFTAFEGPARQSLVPVLIDRAHLTEGMSLNWATFNVAFFTGPLIAGFLLSWGGAQLAFTTAIFTLVVMLVTLLRIHADGEPRWSEIRIAGLWPDLMSGVRYTTRHPVIPWVIGFHMVMAVALRPYVDLMPGIAVKVFAADAQGLASLLAASGIGALAVSVAMILAAREQWLVRFLVWGQVASGFGLLTFIASDNFILGLVSLFFLGGFTCAAGIAAATLIQQNIDGAYRGRVVSISLAINLGTPAIGALGLGWLAEVIGFRPSLAIGAVLALMVMALGSKRLIRAHQDQPN